MLGIEDFSRQLALPSRELAPGADKLELRLQAVAANGEFLGLLGLADTPRPDAAETVAALRRDGLEVWLVTGDHARTAHAIADGAGIEADFLPRMFEPFVQGRALEGRQQAGLGVGLALVKELVELHGGWVALESEPGHGSTFTCHLPEAAHVETGQKELGF